MAAEAVGLTPRELPTFYYHRHFLEMLDFVAAHYGHVLSAQDFSLLEAFRALEHAPQCLYVRLVNRKGRVFRRCRLRYPEIGALDAPLDELRAGDWAGTPDASHLDEVLAVLTRAELHRWLADLRPDVGRSLSHDALVALGRGQAAELGRLAPDLVLQRRTRWVRWLLFLYFGERQDALERFTLRDLGIMRTHAFRDTYEPRFTEREEAQETFYFADRLGQYRSASPERRDELACEAEAWPSPAAPGAALLRDRLAFAMGRDLESTGDTSRALAVYRLGESAECTERVVRAMVAAGRRDEACAFLEERIAEPRSDEEGFFAAEFLARSLGGKRRSALTDALRAAETIALDESQRDSPERAAIDLFEARGHRAYAAENRLWRTLFGLLFWEELYEAPTAGLHSPFEFVPASLRDGSFHAVNAAAIEAKLAGLGDGPGTQRRILRVATARYGTANGLFRWRGDGIETVLAFLERAEPAAVADILRRMSRDYRAMRHGFPDLLVLDSAGVRFVEIKAPGDQLRRGQLLRLNQLRSAGFRADIVRVDWVVDPKQAYVVVDVETTGGSGEQHRVTELAAVKLREGRIEARFQTLLNPQRPIPRQITQLTGISDDMVAGAPLFAEIADEFEEFMAGAIFVAHNVNFDYGFVAREYARLGRRFRHPRLCTCASMRRYYPGHRSYSLGALCEAHGISLQRHHRALCDAEAAAGLLMMVNERRMAAGPNPAG